MKKYKITGRERRTLKRKKRLIYKLIKAYYYNGIFYGNKTEDEYTIIEYAHKLKDLEKQIGETK